MTANTLTPSEKCAEKVAGYEGIKLKAYPDPKTGGKPFTIGCGTTVYPSGKSVTLGETCTKDQAIAYLKHDLIKFGNYVNQYVTVKLNQNQFDALTSIVYNVGPGSKYKDGIIFLKNGSPSTLLRKLNSGDYQGAADQFLRWVSPGTSVTAGLTKRRTDERAWFLS